MSRLEALAFNALTQALSEADRFVALSERQKAARAVLDAVLPEFEQQIREKVAEEILADVAGLFAARVGADLWEAAFHSARVARGES